MSQFNYTDEEKNINRVLKMNRDSSNQLLSGLQSSTQRNEADSNINDSVALLRSLGYSKDVDKIFSEKKSVEYIHKPQAEQWDEIVSQAIEYCPQAVELEDIMTQAEIQASFDELDSISKAFSQKTNIIHKTDLSFLFTATALQVAKSLIFLMQLKKWSMVKASTLVKD